MLIQRQISDIIKNNLYKGKIIIVYGARRVGKTTLAKQIAEDIPKSKYINCELLQNKTALETTNSNQLRDLFGNQQLIILDEAQTINNLGQILKIAVDTFPEIQILATGSSSFNLAGELSEPLTGRSRKYILYPFSIQELSNHISNIEIKSQLEKYMRFGFYPEVHDKGESEAIEELNAITSDYLYKDVLQYQNIKKPNLVINLLRALALQIGSEVKTGELANMLKQNSHTIERYLEILEKSFVIVRLTAFSQNLRKEINKSQKVYFYDLGIRNSLIQNFNPLNLRNDTGGMWENFCIIERLKHLNNSRMFVNSYFWRTYDQKEIDYLEEEGGMLHAFEFKFKTSKTSKSFFEFNSHYPNSDIKVITRDNIYEELLD